MPNFLKFFGFDRDDYEDEEYEDESPRSVKKTKAVKEELRKNFPELVFFKGVPSEGIKLRLRDALLEGTMVLLDLHGLPPERVEEGRAFINFMGGVAFAHKGLLERIGSSLFVITPREGMLQWWTEEE